MELIFQKEIKIQRNKKHNLVCVIGKNISIGKAIATKLYSSISSENIVLSEIKYDLSLLNNNFDESIYEDIKPKFPFIKKIKKL